MSDQVEPSDGPSPAPKGAALANLLAWALFWCALGIHAGYVWDMRVHPGHGRPQLWAAQGAPYGDARALHELGDDRAAGRDLTISWWSARRPLYPWFLAAIYAATNNSYEAALAANVIFVAISTALLVAIGRQLYGLPVGLMVGASFAFSGITLDCSCTSLSELMGLFLLVWHFWLLLKGCLQRRLTPLVYSGVLFGLSNAARTLTLLAAPGYAVCLALLFVRHEGRWQWKRSFQAVAAFAAGTSVIVLAFMSWNYWRNGIFTISENSAYDLYCVTSPEYGRYDVKIETELASQGMFTIPQRYHYCMQQARKNLREHPRLLWTRSLDNLHVATLRMAHFPPQLFHALWFLLACAWWPWPRKGFMRRLAGWLPVAGIVWIAMRQETPSADVARGLFVVCLLVSLVGLPRGVACLLGCVLAFTLFAVGLFGSMVDRLYLMFLWEYYAVILGGVWMLLGWTRGRALDEPRPITVFPVSLPPKVAALAYGAVAAPLLLGTALCLYRNATAAPVRALPLPAHPTADELIARAVQEAPELFTADERLAPSNGDMLPANYVIRVTPQGHGRLVALWGRFAHEPFYYPYPVANAWNAGVATELDPRPYAYTAQTFFAIRADGGWGVTSLFWPGDIRELKGRNVLVIGRLLQIGKSSPIVEGIALCAAPPGADSDELLPVLWGYQDPGHRHWLEQSVPAAANP